MFSSRFDCGRYSCTVRPYFIAVWQEDLTLAQRPPCIDQVCTSKTASSPHLKQPRPSAWYSGIWVSSVIRKTRCFRSASEKDRSISSIFGKLSAAQIGSPQTTIVCPDRAKLTMPSGLSKNSHSLSGSRARYAREFSAYFLRYDNARFHSSGEADAAAAVSNPKPSDSILFISVIFFHISTVYSGS